MTLADEQPDLTCVSGPPSDEFLRDCIGDDMDDCDGDSSDDREVLLPKWPDLEGTGVEQAEESDSFDGVDLLNFRVRRRVKELVVDEAAIILSSGST